MQQDSKQRIAFLDGLRGLAILGVLIFHAYGSYPQFLPFGDRFIFVPVRLGYLGVQLFFIISGFVILMTLERCESLLEFGKRRWFRLFPAMLAASLIVLAYDKGIGSGPFSDRTAADLIPGLIFVSPELIHSLTGYNLQSMDGQFWSLYVEVCFYVIFGAVYFLAGTSVAIRAIFSIYVVSLLAALLSSHGVGGSLFARASAALDWMGFGWFGWFVSGSLFYLYQKEQRPLYLWAAIGMGMICAIAADPTRLTIADHLGMAFVVLLFAAAMEYTSIKRIICWRPFLFLGFVSYPLYLIHSNIMVGLENDIGKALPSLPAVLDPVVPILLLILTAWAIVVFIEKPFGKLQSARRPAHPAVAPSAS